MFDPFVEALRQFGAAGISIACFILAAVFFARKAGLIVTGGQARIANLVLGAILAGLSGDPAADTALTAVLSSLLAALMFELFKTLAEKLKPVLQA
jgi:VIT1/CCC1 family predicted Fe2+/Mn2+ transporter